MKVKFNKPKKVISVFNNVMQFEDESTLSLIRISGEDRKPVLFNVMDDFEVTKIEAKVSESMQSILMRLYDKEGNSLGLGIEIPDNSIYSLAYLRKKKFLPKDSEVITFDTNKKD